MEVKGERLKVIPFTLTPYPFPYFCKRSLLLPPALGSIPFLQIYFSCSVLSSLSPLSPLSPLPLLNRICATPGMHPLPSALEPSLLCTQNLPHFPHIFWQFHMHRLLNENCRYRNVRGCLYGVGEQSTIAEILQFQVCRKIGKGAFF